MTVNLAQAIRNAIEAERGAEEFYQELALAAADAKVRALLLEMAAEEHEHAAGLALVARQLVGGALPLRADMAVRNIESAPGLQGARGLDFGQALSLALEAEISAALYYDALASSCTGEVSAFFESVAKVEERHAERIRAVLAGGTGGAQSRRR